MTKVQKELKQIAKQAGGILRPEAVVERASDPESALHEHFTWDDTKAAQEYRLWQARQIIRVSVVVLDEENEPVRTYVSLTTDRKNVGGGYRPIEVVLSDEEMREQMLADAFADLKMLREKYKRLKELSEVFAAAAAAQKAHSSSRRKARKAA